MTLDIIYSLSRSEWMQNVEIKIWIFYLNVKRYTNIVRRPILSNSLYYVTLIFISLHSVFHINQTCIK
jgi:hypothetical protein